MQNNMLLGTNERSILIQHLGNFTDEDEDEHEDKDEDEDKDERGGRGRIRKK